MMKNFKLTNSRLICLVVTLILSFTTHADLTKGNNHPPLRLMIIGAPGVGKGTQAKRLAQQYNIPQISTGDILRSEIQHGTPLGLKAKKIMDSGNLLSDELIFSLVQERLKQPDCKHGFILDGFPRTQAQAELLKNAKIYLDYIIEIKVDDKEIIKRMSGRRIHQPSGRVYHIIYNPPKQPGIDDVTGQPLVQRKDDEAATVRSRLVIYHQQTEPLIQYYEQWSRDKREGSPKLFHISGNKNINQIFNQIVNKINMS